jgi:hypothetical protein
VIFFFFLRQCLERCLPRPVSNPDPSDLSLLSSWDSRREPPVPGYNLYLMSEGTEAREEGAGPALGGRQTGTLSGVSTFWADQFFCLMSHPPPRTV